MRAKRGRQETDDPLLTPWELGKLGALGAGCRVQGVERWSGAPWHAASDKGRGDMQQHRSVIAHRALRSRGRLTDDVHVAGTVSHMDVEAR